MMRWVRGILQKHRLLAAGLGVALACLLVLAWAWYGVCQSANGRSKYEQINDDYTQVVDPTDPRLGLEQAILAGPDTPLYGVRLLFSTHDRVVRGTLYVDLLSAEGEVLARAACDMTELLDNTFKGLVFDRPVFPPEEDTPYRLHVYYEPETPEDVVGLWASEEPLPGFALADLGGMAPSQHQTAQEASGKGTAALQYMVDHSGRFASWAFWVPGLLLLAAVLGGWWLIFVKRAGVTALFCWLAAWLGLAAALVVPPLAGPDEYVHASTAYANASRLLGQEPYRDGQLALRACDAPYMTDKTGEVGIFAYKRMAEQLLRFGNSGELTGVGKVRIPYKPNQLLYAPQTLGVLTGRVLGASFYGMLLLGRLFNLAAYTALTALALRWLPRGKNILFCVALLPMALQLAAGFAPDALLLGLVFAWSAFCLHCCAQPFCTGRDAAVLAILAACLAPAKAIYLPLIGLCLLIPAVRWGRRGGVYKTLVLLVGLAAWCVPNLSYVRYVMRDLPAGWQVIAPLLLAAAVLAALGCWRLWNRAPRLRRAIVAALCVLGAAGALAGIWLAANLGADPTPQQMLDAIQPNGDSAYMFNIGYTLRNLPTVVKLVIQTLCVQLPSYLQGMLGTVLGEPVVYKVETSWVYTLGLVLVLLAAALPAQGAQPRLPKRGPLCAVGLCAVSSALCVLACLTWTPINYTLIFGIQGRYFLPLLPLLLLAVGETRAVVRARDLSAGVRMAQLALCALVLLQALCIIAAL